MLLFMDGQAHYDSARIGYKYSQRVNDRVTWTVAAEGRYGHCLKRLEATGGPFTYGYLDIAPLTTRTAAWVPTTGGVCGFAIKIDDLTLQTPGENAGTQGSLFAILDGANFVLKVI